MQQVPVCAKSSVGILKKIYMVGLSQENVVVQIVAEMAEAGMSGMMGVFGSGGFFAFSL